MIPRVGKQGRSFRGSAAYYLHDKDADTSNRVAWTHTENLPSDDPERAFDWMAFTALDSENLKRQAGVRRTGTPSEKPVWTLSLSWHPEEQPTQEHMIDTANSALAVLGLQKHQVIMVAHNDEAHSHVHAVVNLVHPETGRTARLPYTKEKLSKWAEAYEKEHGKIYCNQRVENNKRREEGEFIKYEEPELDLKARITALYRQSDSGEAFRAALAEYGYCLAKGKKVVLIDQTGEIHSLARQIEGAKEKDVRARLLGLELPSVDEARGQQGQAEGKKPEAPAKTAQPEGKQVTAIKETQYFDRDEQDRQWQESIIDAAIADNERKEGRSRSRLKTDTAEDQRRRPNRLQDRHLKELGIFYYESTDARLRLNEEMETAYGNDERRLRAEIAERQNKLSNAGRLRRFLMYVTGENRRTRQEIEQDTLSLRNIEQRKLERAGDLEKRIEGDRQRILERRAQERMPHQTPANVPERNSQRRIDPSRDFRAAQAVDDGYETRRAAFMGRGREQRPREGSNPLPSPQPPASAGRLSADFGAASTGDAGYEARRAAFMGIAFRNRVHDTRPGGTDASGSSAHHS